METRHTAESNAGRLSGERTEPHHAGTLRRLRSTLRRLGSACVAMSLPMLIGCASQQVNTMRAVHYDLDVSIEPDTSHLRGRATVQLEAWPPKQPLAGAPIRFHLHPDLVVKHVHADGEPVGFKRVTATDDSDEEKSDDDASAFQMATYEVPHPPKGSSFELDVSYDGTLFQDVQAGEKEGAIHNRGMRAHIAPEGVYLSGASWYPTPLEQTDAGLRSPPPPPTFHVTVDTIPDFPLVGSGDPDHEREQSTGRHAWQTPYPVDAFAIVGGPHEVHQRSIRGIDVSLHLKPSQAHHADGLFQTVETVLERYEPLVGRYPARTYKIVDNFFSSGFAFPTFTLLSSAVIDMGERAQTAHGYIDHEMLHCWWGNGILVDRSQGNWCESITSYASNYYGHVLDGKPREARRKRRNYTHFLSRLSAEKDKPLGTYGLPEGCGRGVAYEKGAAVFHLLARTMGQASFFTAMRRFTRDYLGRYASWQDIQTVCEAEYGGSLQRFFDQWVHHGGAPDLEIEEAVYNSARQELKLAIKQHNTDFNFEIPVRIESNGTSRDVDVSITGGSSEVVVPHEFAPKTVEIDPDYHVFRKVGEQMITPTTNTTKAGDSLLTILPDGDVPQEFLSIQANFEKRFDEDERMSVTVSALDAEMLKDHSLLILGEAAADPTLAHLFAGLDKPVAINTDQFSFDGVAYENADNALLCTFHHPLREDGGVTVVVANSEQSIPRAGLIPFYPRSLVVFAGGRGSVYHDFETREKINVEIKP